MTIIRLSPSGPPISNDAGEPADIGPGFRMRLAESQEAQSTSQGITTTHVDIISANVQLDLPGEESEYRADAECVIECTGSGDGHLEILTDDGAGGALTQRAVTNFSMATGDKHYFRCHMVLQTLPLAANPTQLNVMARVWFGAGSGQLTSTEPAHVIVEECL